MKHRFRGENSRPIQDKAIGNPNPIGAEWQHGEISLVNPLE
jgi:hypothetical protein